MATMAAMTRDDDGADAGKHTRDQIDERDRTVAATTWYADGDDLQGDVRDPDDDDRATAVVIGMVRRGLRNSAEMWVTASHPENAQMKSVTATPTPIQPFGMNGVKLEASTDGRGHSDDTDDDDHEEAAQEHLQAAAHMQSEEVRNRRDEGEEQCEVRHETAIRAERTHQVLGAENADHRRPEVHAEQEPVARETRDAVGTEGETNERGDTAGVREAGGESGERPGQRDGEQHHRTDGENRGGTGGIRTETRQHQDAGAENSGDVQRRAARRARAGRGRRRRHARGSCSSLTAMAPSSRRQDGCLTTDFPPAHTPIECLEQVGRRDPRHPRCPTERRTTSSGYRELGALHRGVGHLVRVADERLDTTERLRELEQRPSTRRTSSLQQPRRSSETESIPPKRFICRPASS